MHQSCKLTHICSFAKEKIEKQNLVTSWMKILILVDGEFMYFKGPVAGMDPFHFNDTVAPIYRPDHYDDTGPWCTIKPIHDFDTLYSTKHIEQVVRGSNVLCISLNR